MDVADSTSKCKFTKSFRKSTLLELRNCSSMLNLRMEKIVTITKVQPLKERSYINGNGDNEVFVSRGFVMTDGIDTFYAEATGEYARQLPTEFDTTVCHSVQLQIRNFKLSEFIRSETARRRKINNDAPESVIENLRNLCQNVLQPLRDYVGEPITISSGYRCALVNSYVGILYL